MPVTEEAILAVLPFGKQYGMNKTYYLLFLYCLPFTITAQDSSPHQNSLPTKAAHFRVVGVMAHTYVPSGVGADRLFIPSWGLDIEWWQNNHWGVGIHSDLELQTFVIRQRNEETLERAHPFVMSLDLLYRPYKGFVIQIGPGVELERHKDYLLMRTGIEYEFEFHGDGPKYGAWDISPMLFYDHRLKANDTWSIGIGIGRRF
jgi:hypothetical protein